MPKHLPKSLSDYLSKIKKPSNSFQVSSLSFSRILSGCRHPKTPSFAQQNAQNDHDHDAATLSDIDRFLFENFRSLYIRDDDCTESNRNHDVKARPHSPESSTTATLFEPPRLMDPPPDLCGSNRFFVVPGSSGSVTEEGQSTTRFGKTWLKESSEGEECIAVLRYSRNPQEDFRRSMQEMVEVRVEEEGKVLNWDFMEELLFCFLNLNDKKSYKYILGAFVDVVTALRQNDGASKGRRIATERGPDT